MSFNKIYTKAERQKLLTRMRKDIKENGPIRLSLILGFRNTTRIENWKTRNQIPVGMESLVEKALDSTIVIHSKEEA